MMGSRATISEITETVRGAIKQAGSALIVIAALASLALGLAAGACYMAFRALRLIRGTVTA